ncbi:MAG: hypothetical protein WB683_03820 [Candidatus Sulfotelmatobacter sp.]
MTTKTFGLERKTAVEIGGTSSTLPGISHGRKASVREARLNT